MKSFWFFFFVFFLAFTVVGATIQGQVFDAESFEPVDKAIVMVDSVPFQRQVVSGSGFLFEMPNQGTFEFKVFVTDGNEVVSAGSDSITIREDGVYQLDLLVFPALDLNGSLATLLSDDELFEPPLVSDLGSSESLWLIIVVIFLVLLLVGFYFFLESKKSSVVVSEPVVSGVTFSVRQKKMVIDLLRVRGGRLLQKDLRHELNLGEAYFSLLVAELEHDGLIKKIKHGRGNILVLVD